MQDGLLMAEMRAKLNVSQTEMANLMKISLEAYKFYENAIRPMKLEELNFLSNYFNVSLNSLLQISKNKISLNTNRKIDYKYLRFSLKYIRKINRYSQTKLAKKFNLSVPTICKYERHPELVNINYLYLFARHFHVSVDYICGKTLKKEIL